MGNYEKGDPVLIDPGKAYVLVRVVEPHDFNVGPVLVRILAPDELRVAIEGRENDRDYNPEPNVVLVEGLYPYARTGDELVLFASAKPGNYIMAGAAMGTGSNWTPGLMNTCLCMGTVQFEAKAGTITDLGTVLIARDDQPSPIPELASQVRGRSSDVAPLPLDLAVRPYALGMVVPDELASLPHIPAVYRAYNAFPNYFGAPIDRLAPLPGILDYDKDGRVIDLKVKK